MDSEVVADLDGQVERRSMDGIEFGPLVDAADRVQDGGMIPAAEKVSDLPMRPARGQADGSRREIPWEQRPVGPGRTCQNIPVTAERCGHQFENLSGGGSSPGRPQRPDCCRATPEPAMPDKQGNCLPAGVCAGAINHLEGLIGTAGETSPVSGPCQQLVDCIALHPAARADPPEYVLIADRDVLKRRACEGRMNEQLLELTKFLEWKGPGVPTPAPCPPGSSRLADDLGGIPCQFMRRAVMTIRLIPGDTTVATRWTLP